MSKQSFAPKSDHKRDLWLKNFAGKLPTYGAKYGLSVEEVKDMIACALFFTYWLDYQNRIVDYDTKVTSYKNKMRDGVEADSVPPVQPGAPDTGVIPPTVVPGIFNRANSLARRIKNHKDYSSDDGSDLGLEGAEVVAPDLLNIKPVIKVVPGKGGHPEIQWEKGQMSAIDIYVDRGTGGWVFLATDTIPDYTDTAALPAAGESAFWQYRGMYRFDDEQVGQWSVTDGLTVTG